MDFLVDMEQLSKYQYVIGYRIAFSDTWHNNCPGKVITEI